MDEEDEEGEEEHLCEGEARKSAQKPLDEAIALHFVKVNKWPMRPFNIFLASQRSLFKGTFSLGVKNRIEKLERNKGPHVWPANFLSSFSSPQSPTHSIYFCQ